MKMNLDFSLIERYKNIVDFKELDKSPPLLLMHNNTVEYRLGINPIVVNDRRKISYAVRRWNETINKIYISASEAQIYEDVNTVEKLYVLGVLYPDTYLLSSIIPNPPQIPKVFGYKKGNDIVLVKRDFMTRRLYVDMIEMVAKAVIVKDLEK